MTEFPKLQNDTILRVIKGQKVEQTPAWIMRQAGRYLPEFRELRAKHDFFTICRTPELACEITLQPIRRYNGLLDASIIFSDILVVPQALGMEVQMVPKIGPHFPSPLATPADMAGLKSDIDAIKEELTYVFNAITLTRQKLQGQVPLIGFAGAPWTLMAYMIEGGGSKTFTKAKKWLVQYEEESLKLLNLLTDVIIVYCVGQVEAGAQLLQIFDSWAGELTPKHFKKFCLPFLKKIATGVKASLREKGLEVVPMTCFAKGAHASFSLLLDSEYDVFGIDWSEDIGSVKKQCLDFLANNPQKIITLQGNLDPCMLYAPHDTLKHETNEMVSEFLENTSDKIGYICNLGHGIQPEVDPENVSVFLNEVKRISRAVLSSKS